MPSEPQYAGLTWMEMPDSPVYEIGETPSLTQNYQGTWAQAQANAVARGYQSGGYKVDSARLWREDGNKGRLTIVWKPVASGSLSPLPPDTWTVEAVDQTPALARHSRFTALTEAEIAAVEAALNASDPISRASSDSLVAAGSTALQNYKRLRKKGVETFYLPGLRYVWTANYYVLPSLTTGGSIEGLGGPGYSALVGLGWSWLRSADVPQFDGTRFTVVRTWLGVPSAMAWDSYLYA
jgi:hypothetical protein